MECFEDPFETPETLARAQWYGVDGIPDVRIDGKYGVLGATECGGAFHDYLNKYQQRIAETGGMSPVEITGFSVGSDRQIGVTATVRLLDPVTLHDLRATILVYEDDIEKHRSDFYDYHWSRITHVIRDSAITLTVPGDEAMIHEAIDIDPAWNPTRLRVVAYLQTISGNKEVVQAAMLPSVASARFERTIVSLPAGNGLAIFHGRVTNGSDRSRTFVIEPGAPFGDWPSSFTICDGQIHDGPVEITLNAGESCPLDLRVQTNGAREVREGGVRVTVEGSALDVSGRVFNGSPSIYVIDGGGTMASTLDAIGCLHDNWPGGDDPLLRILTDYDILLYDYVSWPDPGFLQSVGAFMDGGGSVLLASDWFLDDAGGSAFARDYLGVGRSFYSRAYRRASGMTGDPIGDGLHLHLADDPTNDCVMPDVTAQIVLMSDVGLPAAIRKTRSSGVRSVFMPFNFESISASDPDPDNRTTVARRIVDWFTGGDLAGVSPIVTEQGSSRILGIRPNPFRQGTRIDFALSARAAGGPARLEVFDPSGRRVGSLVSARLSAGNHSQSWNGLTDAGRRVESGVYFVKLSTADGVRTQKIIAVK